MYTFMFLTVCVLMVIAILFTGYTVMARDMKKYINELRRFNRLANSIVDLEFNFEEVENKPEKRREIFVFGSNTLGQHGGGSARAAYEKYGAAMGIAYGITGDSFAIPTLDHKYRQLDLATIQSYVNGFIAYAVRHEEMNFTVVEIGCGIAGFKVEQIAPMFKNALDMDNVVLPQSFVKFLKEEQNGKTGRQQTDAASPVGAMSI